MFFLTFPKTFQGEIARVHVFCFLLKMAKHTGLVHRMSTFYENISIYPLLWTPKVAILTNFSSADACEQCRFRNFENEN